MPTKQLSHWPQVKEHSTSNSSDPSRPSVMHAEPPRPIEPGGSHDVSIPYSHHRLREDSHMPQRQQLPGVQELLSPSVRTGARSPITGSWAPINNPSAWRDRMIPASKGIPLPADDPTHSLNSVHRHHPMEHSFPGTYRSSNQHQPIGVNIQQQHHHQQQQQQQQQQQRQPSMSDVSLRPSERSSPRSLGRAEYTMRGAEHFSSSSYHAITNAVHHDSFSESILERRHSSTLSGRAGPAGSLLSLQIVSQRDIPGEGLCYVFKDGSTCPTIIDGEPVNPLWGTTKAGKARKRLAQACL